MGILVNSYIDPSLAYTLNLVGLVTLLALLIQAEVLAGVSGRFSQVLKPVLNVGIIPLLIGFLMTIIVRLGALLR